MRLTVKHEQGVRFAAECRGHRVTIDQPEDNGGSDQGMTPPELLAASLAGCIGFYVARYCEQAKIDVSGLTVGCDWVTGGEPKMMQRLEVIVRLPNCPENRRKAVERVAASCLIHHTLCGEPEVNVQLEDTA